MKRRSFLKASSVAAPAFISGVPVSSIAKSALSYHMNGESDRVLVLIQLGGGNDGLNCIIPRDQYDNLAAVRNNILVPESSILPITDTIGFNPNMGGLKEVFDAGKLGVVQNVGYPNHIRSHFRSTDVWHTGSDANEYLDTGWIGRYFDSIYDNFPAAYPNQDCPDPFALTIGSLASETCQGVGGSFSMVVSNPNDLTQLSSPVTNDLASGCAADALDFMIKSIEQTNDYGDVIRAANDLGNNLSSKYPDGNNLAEQLKIVARLISGGLRTKVFIVNLGGFDTHANQVVEGDTTNGEQAVLLATLSDAICAFQDDLNQLNLEKRVIGMTYSEFGRRIKSNFSLGTDHGDAAPLMLFGSCVNPSIHGTNPIIDPDVSDNAGVDMEFDFRSVYGSILMDWFDVDEANVKALLHEDFTYLPIIDFNCIDTVLAIDLFDFYVMKEGTNAKLEWAANTSSGISHFDVQHSMDGNQFVSLGNVNVLAGANDFQSYQYLHKNPQSGVNYYRIKEVHDQGKIEFSVIKELNFDVVSSDISLFPNPADSKLNIEINTNSNEKIILQFINELGQVIKKVSGEIRSGRYQIDIHDLTPGFYFVKISIKHTTITKKLTIL